MTRDHLLRVSTVAIAIGAVAPSLGAGKAEAASLDFDVQVTELVGGESAFFDPPEVGDVGQLRISFSPQDFVLREATNDFAAFDLFGDWNAGLFTSGGDAVVEGFEDDGQLFSLEIIGGPTDVFRLSGFDSIGESFSLEALDPLGLAFSGAELADIGSVLAALSSAYFTSGTFVVTDDAGAGPSGVLRGGPLTPIQPVPEPAGVLLYCTGGVLVFAALRRNSNRKRISCLRPR